MTREEIIDLLTFARVYDARVTIGKTEATAWFLAISRVPFGIGQQAVVEHYTAPVEPGGSYPRLAPGHVMAYYQSQNRPYDRPLPAITSASPKATPEFAAARKAEIAGLIERAAGAYALDAATPDEVPRWRPGMDKQQLALAQVEASRRARAGGVRSG